MAMRRNPSSRFTTSTVTAGILIALLGILVAPAPAEATGCLGCKRDLVCGGGATCWLFEWCDEGAAIVANICHLNWLGECMLYGDLCFNADADSTGLEPFGLELGSVADSCRVAEAPATESEGLGRFSRS
jgi:hypothetical protein